MTEDNNFDMRNEKMRMVQQFRIACHNARLASDLITLITTLRSWYLAILSEMNTDEKEKMEKFESDAVVIEGSLTKSYFNKTIVTMTLTNYEKALTESTDRIFSRKKSKKEVFGGYYG